MKYYQHVKAVELTPTIVECARIFATQVAATTCYNDSNQFSLQKITDDHFVSKLGEEAAKLVLSQYVTVHGPDYQIYGPKQKSWKDDLYVGQIGVAVKTQRRSVANRFGLSWTFQAGPYRKDVILSKPDAWVIFVALDDINPFRCLVYPPFQIKELTFGEPVLSRLKGHKVVVYASTLKIN